MRKDPETGFLEPAANYALTGFNAQLKSAIIAYLTKSYNISAACHAVGLKDSRSFYHHLRIDEEFRAAVDNARETHLDELESTMFRNGTTPRGVADRIFALKSWRKERYGERTVIEHQKRAPVENLFGTLHSTGEVIDVEPVPTSPPIAHTPPAPYAEPFQGKEVEGKNVPQKNSSDENLKSKSPPPP